MSPLEAMRRAIRLTATTHPHPNPRVGAVLLDRNGNVVSEGAHSGPGEPHAERVALDAAPRPLPDGTTLVVTLEPCNHHGRTPPCTEVLIERGVERVVVGAADPDSRVSGQGISRLRQAGLEIETDVLASEVEGNDPAYFHHRRTGRPLVVLKRASTLDGQTAALDGSSRWITGEAARRDTHLLRAESDAVMVGAGTLRADDPELTVRLPGYSGPQPTAIVVAGSEPIPADLSVFGRSDTVTVTARPRELPGQVLIVEPREDGYPDIDEALLRLGDQGLIGILVEGGARLAATLWKRQLVDRGVTYLGGLMAGGTGIPLFSGPWKSMADAGRVEILDSLRLDGDVRIDWRPVWG